MRLSFNFISFATGSCVQISWAENRLVGATCLRISWSRLQEYHWWWWKSGELVSKLIKVKILQKLIVTGCRDKRRIRCWQDWNYKVCPSISVLSHVRCFHVGSAANSRGKYHSWGIRWVTWRRIFIAILFLITSFRFFYFSSHRKCQNHTKR